MAKRFTTCQFSYIFCPLSDSLHASSLFVSLSAGIDVAVTLVIDRIIDVAVLSFKTSRKKKREFFSSGRLKAVQIFFLVHISLVARSERQRCEKMSFIKRKT